MRMVSFALFAWLAAVGFVVLPGIEARCQTVVAPEDIQERDGLFYRGGDAQPFTGMVRDLHESGKPRLEAQYQAGKLASSKVWYESGQQAEDVSANGEVWTIKRYDEKGRLEEETVATFRNGRKISERSRLWHETGKLRIEAGFEGGKLSGPLREYDENGVLVRDEIYDQGKLVKKAK